MLHDCYSIKVHKASTSVISEQIVAKILAVLQRFQTIHIFEIKIKILKKNPLVSCFFKLQTHKDKILPFLASHGGEFETLPAI